MPPAALDEAQSLVSWRPRAELDAFLAELAHRVGYGRVVSPAGHLTGYATDVLVRSAHNARACPAC